MGLIDRFFGTGRTSLGGTALGFALAPFVGSFLYGWVLVCAAVAQGRSEAGPGELLIMGLVFAFVAALFGSIIAYPAMLAVGVPSWLVLRWARAEGALPYALCGACGGWMIGPIKRGWSFFGEPAELQTATAGALVLLTFWWLARDRRPVV